jgi:hypothetical protein
MFLVISCVHIQIGHLVSTGASVTQTPDAMCIPLQPNLKATGRYVSSTARYGTPRGCTPRALWICKLQVSNPCPTLVPDRLQLGSMQCRVTYRQMQQRHCTVITVLIVCTMHNNAKSASVTN